MSIFKKVLTAVIAVLILLSGVWCGLELYRYAKARSVWDGEIGIEYEFSQSAFDFTKYGAILDEDPDTRSWGLAETSLPVPSFDGSKRAYFIRFNDYYTFDVSRTLGTVTGNLYMAFLSPAGTAVGSSDVWITVSFFSDRTELKLDCTASAAPYLQKYLDLNGLHVQVLTPEE